MSNASISSRYLGASCAALVVASVLGACGPNNPLPGGIARAEVFDFNFVRLQTNANGEVVVPMQINAACRNLTFTPSELADALRTKQFPLANTTMTFRFEALAPCQTVGEVKFDTTQLSEAFTDPSGNQARRRPHDTNTLLALVVSELSSGGVMDVGVFGVKLVGTTTSRTNQPGPIDLTSAETPASSVGGTQGIYTHANVNPVYAQAQLSAVLASPNRFTATFEFLAKTDPASTEVLLVFDGDMVLRLDIED